MMEKITVAVTKKITQEVNKKQLRKEVLGEGIQLLMDLNEDNKRYLRRIEREHAKLYPRWW